MAIKVQLIASERGFKQYIKFNSKIRKGLRKEEVT